jgi:CheY-like chemotaxis protein
MNTFCLRLGENLRLAGMNQRPGWRALRSCASKRAPPQPKVRFIIAAFAAQGTLVAASSLDAHEALTRRSLMHSILLVDDEPDILAAWRLILEGEGYAVGCASNGAEAIACTASHVPDLIITDWMMPVMDGAELCRRLKAMPQLAGVPVLIHSAVAPPDGEAKNWTASLRKPVGTALFLTTVTQLCKHRH